MQARSSSRSGRSRARTFRSALTVAFGTRTAAVRWRCQRRLRCRLAEWLDTRRDPPRIQDRHRRFDRRTDGSVRVPRARLRRCAARVSTPPLSRSNIFVSGSLFGMLSQVLFGEALADTGPLASLIAQHVDATFLQHVAAAHDRRPTSLHRHGRPRLAALRGVEHGSDRQGRFSGQTAAVPPGHAGVGVDSGRVPAGVLRGGGQRAALRRNARRRRRGRHGLLHRWTVQPVRCAPARRRPSGTRRDLRDP